MLHYILKLYTWTISRKFHSFGKNSVIKPFLNTSNSQYISMGENVDIGVFCRITVSVDFNGHKCKSTNPVRLRLGNKVSIGNNGFISANNNVEIGNNIIMSAYVFISDHDHGFDDMNKSIHDQPLTDNGYVIIKDNAFLGVKSTVLKNVTIGEHAIVSANAVVTRDVPAYTIVAGNPAKVIKKYNFEKKAWEKA